MNTKTCKKCNLEKELDKFHKDKTAKFGVRNICKNCAIETYTEYRKDKPKRIYVKRDQMVSHRKRTYGISNSEYEYLLDKQANRCKICTALFTVSVPVCVDHNHITGKVRGLLCKSCNVGLGYFKDSQFLLNKAVDYLSESL